MDRERNHALAAHLEKLVTDNKKQLIEAVLQHRSRYVTVVLEHIQKPHNASAVLRTVEALGLQEFHMIGPAAASADGRREASEAIYEANPGIVKGAVKWIDIHNYGTAGNNNTLSCLRSLKERGYAVAVTSPHARGYTPEQLPLDRPLALVFGNEQAGVSQTALEAADYFLQIPMWGFTESYNLSVSAAICLYTLMNRIRNSKHPWPLSDAEKLELRLQWYRKLVKRAAVIESELMRNYDQKPD